MCFHIHSGETTWHSPLPWHCLVVYRQSQYRTALPVLSTGLNRNPAQAGSAGILSKKRALRIIYGDQIKEMSYFNALFLANLESIKDSRNKISKSFFKQILSCDSCLHSLLPPERNTKVLPKLRNPTKYSIPHSRTKRYQSFLNYALAHYQK